jgi:RHS repeat-associated protein
MENRNRSTELKANPRLAFNCGICRSPRDRLGNNRVVLEIDKVNSLVTQTTDYYPFGMPYANSQYPERQPYKFGDKELDEMHGLNWYDFNARQFSTAIPRFTTMDPMAEKYYSISPYAYCGNNPVRFKDPDGRNPITALRGAYKAYKVYKAYRATRKAAVAATAGAVVGTESKQVYNYFVSGDTQENADKVFNSLMERANLATSPEYQNQQKREREAKDKQNQQEANIQQTVVNGGHNPQDSGGDFNPNNPNPNKISKVVAGTVAAGILIEQIEANGDSKQNPPAQQQLQDQSQSTPKQEQPQQSLWDRIINFFNF